MKETNITKTTRVLNKLGRITLLMGIFVLSMGTFIAGYSQNATFGIKSSAGEDILLQKDKYIQNIISYDDSLSGYAVGKRASELDQLSLEKLQTVEQKGIRIVINAEPTSYIDTDTRTVYISIKASDEGQVIDFVNDLLRKI